MSAMLSTGKKKGVFDYNGGGALLMQGQDDDVVIRLLKEDIEDTTVVHSVSYDKKTVTEALNQPVGPENCYMCSKKVYPTERIAPNNKVMHKRCFACKSCSSKLRLDAYCLNNGTFYCKSCYEKMFKAMGGGYQF